MGAMTIRFLTPSDPIRPGWKRMSEGVASVARAESIPNGSVQLSMSRRRPVMDAAVADTVTRSCIVRHPPEEPAP